MSGHDETCQKKNEDNKKKMIHSEKNKEKQHMLHEVFMNNRDYARERAELLRLGNIIDVMKRVDRRYFAPAHEAIYADMPLPIGHGQTISQPTTVARMLLLARLEKGMNVLEIGGGSGWNASLAGELVKPGKVLAVERIAPLVKLAQANFHNFIKATREKVNTKFIFADALDKKNEFWKQKYDRIIVTAGASAELTTKLHEMAGKLLKENGLLVYPTSEHGVYGSLEIWKNERGKLHKLSREEGYSFVPLLKGEEK